MSDLNHLYAEYVIRNAIRERDARACAWDQLAAATATRPSPLQRAITRIRHLLQALANRPTAPVGMADAREKAVC